MATPNTRRLSSPFQLKKAAFVQAKTLRRRPSATVRPLNPLPVALVPVDEKRELVEITLLADAVNG